MNTTLNDEMVDVVDEQDQVISQVLKSEAHTQGLLHRTVIAELRNSVGKWLLVRHLPTKQDGGLFVNAVGGHVQAGETAEEALLREGGEELGISDFTYTFKGSFVFNRHVLNRHENHLFVVYEILSDVEPVLGDEANEFVYLTTEELREKLRTNRAEFGESLLVVVEKLYPELLV